MIRRLLQLNGLAILGVVLNHTTSWGYVAMFWWTDRYQATTVPNFDQLGSPAYFGLRTVSQLVIVSIPIFLFVSGFFVAVAAGRGNRTVGWQTVGSRITGLLIPYVIWSAIIVVIDYVLLDVQRTPWQFARMLLFGGAIDGYYYVPLLCQLYLLAPLIVPLARNHWQPLLAVTLALQLYVLLGAYQSLLDTPWLAFGGIVQFYSWTFPGYILWFCLGTVVGFHLSAFKERIARLRWFFLAAALLLLPVGIAEWEILLHMSGQDWIAPVRVLSHELFSAAVILSFLAFSDAKLPYAGALSTLGVQSFGIYLIHSLVLLWAAKAIYHVAPAILGQPLLFQVILFTLGLGVPLAFMAIVNRSPIRKVSQTIFG